MDKKRNTKRDKKDKMKTITILLMLCVFLFCAAPTEPEQPHVNVDFEFNIINIETHGINVLIATQGIVEIEAWFYEHAEIEVRFTLKHSLKCSENKDDYTIIDGYSHIWIEDAKCGTEKSQFVEICYENVLHEFPKMEYGSYFAEVTYRHRYKLCGQEAKGASKTKISDILYWDCNGI